MKINADFSLKKMHFITNLTQPLKEIKLEITNVILNRGIYCITIKKICRDFKTNETDRENKKCKNIAKYFYK